MRALVLASFGGLAIAITVAASSCNTGQTQSPTNPTSSGAGTIVILGELGNQSFTPNPASLGGLLVAWRNNHGVTHRIVANDGSFDTGDIAPGATSAGLDIPAAGTNYHCSIHPTTMFGAIGGADGASPPTCMGEYCCCD